MRFLYVYWPALFAVGTMGLMFFIVPKSDFPPTFDTTGAQAKLVLTSPVFLAVVIPIFVGLFVISSFVKRNSLSASEHQAMVWWLTNLFWFHTGCDVLSGYYQIMPVLTDLYAIMSPQHLQPRWHESRSHLDGGYALELFCEVPFAAYVLWLYFQRDPARHFAEVLALGVQFGGTIVYYAPGLAKMESASWLSYMDRSCGSVWLIYPMILTYRHMTAQRPKKKNSGKKTK
eukprot:TRINITY_DN81313_c0_g1_i1.p1 TRINITY_DN81313_c0_g1~~TRINITY_DN81313_c0_g1_i1.p1  ORF type:complete len:230 (+),score=38.74 TRINITY_DN81313_c0_g1_i1:75-764(+)